MPITLIPSGVGFKPHLDGCGFFIMRCRVYIDGFNLYFGALKSTSYKWVNPYKLCELLLPPSYDIQYVKYFTAKVSGTPRDPTKPTRQQMLFRALATLPRFKIILGSFQSHKVLRPLAVPVPGLPAMVVVEDTKEKGSDVNLAAHLIADGYRNLYDVAVLVTNDSDLITPIRMVREDLHKMVGVLNPQKKQSVEIQRYADYCLPITPASLQSSQFPNNMTDKTGDFHKPISW